VVLDLYARKIVGWASGRSANDTLTINPLRQAIINRRPKSGLLHHSDRGAAYTAGRYQQGLQKHGIVQSLSRPANFWTTLQSKASSQR